MFKRKKNHLFSSISDLLWCTVPTLELCLLGTRGEAQGKKYGPRGNDLPLCCSWCSYLCRFKIDGKLLESIPV